MINATELRIGNLLYSNSGRNATVYKVMGVDIESDRAKMKCNPAVSEIQLIYMVPIPITPEWLNKCGFVNKGNGVYYGPEIEHDNEIESFDLKEHSGGFYRLMGSEWPMGNPFQYLHQLQNLYFALRGQELTIKETV